MNYKIAKSISHIFKLSATIVLTAGITACDNPSATISKDKPVANAKTPEVISDALSSNIVQKRNLLNTPSDDYIMVVAHRACWQNAPENSVAAINACIGVDVDMIEIDIRKTKDNQLVIMHDVSVDRTTNGTGLVSELTLSEIQGLTLKDTSGEGQPLTDQHPPSLREALQAIKGKVLVNLDLKESLFEDAFAIVEELDMADQILMKMNAGAESDQLKQASFVGKVNFMPIMFECDPFYEVYCENTLSTAVDDYRDFDPVAFEVIFQNDIYITEAIKAVQGEGARLWVNTLFEKHAAGRVDADALDDPDAIWGEVVDLGFNIIQTDYPAELITYLEGRELRKVPTEFPK